MMRASPRDLRSLAYTGRAEEACRRIRRNASDCGRDEFELTIADARGRRQNAPLCQSSLSASVGDGVRSPPHPQDGRNESLRTGATWRSLRETILTVFGLDWSRRHRKTAVAPFLADGGAIHANQIIPRPFRAESSAQPSFPCPRGSTGLARVSVPCNWAAKMCMSLRPIPPLPGRIPMPSSVISSSIAFVSRAAQLDADLS